MTEKPRSAAEILEYCSKATEEPWTVLYGAVGRLSVAHLERDPFKQIKLAHVDTEDSGEALGSNPPSQQENNLFLMAQARTDLPRVLNAAVELRRVLGIAQDAIISAGMYPRTLEETEDVLDDTKWLEDGE